MLDPDMDDEALVTVYLADLDEDEVGAEWGATELLLDSGWRIRIDVQRPRPICESSAWALIRESIGPCGRRPGLTRRRPPDLAALLAGRG
jgi:hypothetical protein